MKFIFIPFAGSMGYETIKWKKELAPDMTNLNVVYPGRGKRSNEPYAPSWEVLIEDVYRKVCELIADEEDYVLYGHSMGVPITYEIYYKLKQNDKKLPKHLFFSGNDIPPICNRNKKSQLSDEDFKDYFVSLGGISEEVLACKELSDMLFDILRADIKILDAYVYEPKDEPVSCKVSVLNGEKDDKTSTAGEWKELLGVDVEFKIFEGGHFFIFEHEDEVLDYIKSVR